ncbi:prephenate dehydrogenase [Austwickia chelonae]|uniref:prephenate dehydrogenase n=1 Tax=Austwickia chelonae TaxID=100225 RepID=UPI000E2533ED|nr:prephenate dehydrogenase [Austwickia chelonae]
MNHADLRHIRVVGTGLIGASVGLALRRAGAQVTLDDPSPTAAALARDLGAGRLPAADDHEPDLVVVAAPPDVVATVVVHALRQWPRAVVTDVASVKATVLRTASRLLRDQEADPGALSRYVGGHPMAGRERSGAVAAREDLFEGRPWVVCAHPGAAPEAVDAVAWMATRAGGSVVHMSAEDHDAAVAAVSHTPQLAASLVAARLRDLPSDAVGLSGQGVRDVTRIAESDPALWTQILAGNARPVADVVTALRDDLNIVLDALTALADDPDEAPGARAALARAVATGQSGRARIPGKHGAASARYGVVTVVVPDTPGTIGRLLTEVGDAGVNLEDLRIEHGVGRPVGTVELVVLPAAVDPLARELTALGWSVHV